MRMDKYTGISSDSRLVREGYIFAAIVGNDANGESYIGDAIGRGARAVLCRRDCDVALPSGVERIESDNVRLDYARLAASLYGPQPRNIVAVTGTDGKTSTAEFTRQIWGALGLRSASIGTLGVSCDFLSGDALPPFPNTTPDAALLHRILQEFAREGVQHVAMEASSHGLDQYRLDGVKLRAAAFTSFGHDHGDYHGSVEDYFAAKSRLFRELLPSSGGVAVLNADNPQIYGLSDSLLAKGVHVVAFGRNGGADLRIEELRPVARGLEVKLNLYGVEWSGSIGLYGDFQVMNILSAIGLVLSAYDIDDWRDIIGDRIVTLLPDIGGISGRMERVASYNGAEIFIDYAHTPDALEKLLCALRPHVAAGGRLHVVFGCGGDRDKDKRPRMGMVACSRADMVVVTDDNPRGEDASSIRADIISSCEGYGHRLVEVADRVEAIHHAMQQLERGDILVIAGKGHESEQIIGSEVLPHSDRDVVLKFCG